MSRIFDYNQLKNEATKFDSNYSVIASLKTPNVNPGDEIKISVFISGYGIPNFNKLSIIHTQPNMLNENNVGEIVTPILSTDRDELISGKMATWWHKEKTQMDLDRVGGTIHLIKAAFLPHPTERMDRFDHNTNPLPIIVSEQVHGNIPPIEVTYNVSEDARPGNYDISTIFTYTSNQITKQTKSTVTVHVNNQREQLEPWFTRVAMAGVAIALLGFLYETQVFRLFFDLFVL